MSLENVKKFYEEIIQKNAHLVKRFKKVNSTESFYQLLVQIGQENGYIFTFEDVENFVNQSKEEVTEAELSDRELETVAGGCTVTSINPLLSCLYDSLPGCFYTVKIGNCLY